MGLWRREFSCQWNQQVRRVSGTGFAKKSAYPLYPSVMHLLQENNVSMSDVPKITATGPNGRLLKGDVLSYIGQLAANYSSEQADRIQTLGQLDRKYVRATAKVEHPAPKPPSNANVDVSTTFSPDSIFALQVKLRQNSGVDIPLDNFVARATVISNKQLPAASQKWTSSELFDMILAHRSPDAPRCEQGKFQPVVSSDLAASRKPDIYEILTSKSKQIPHQPIASGSAKTLTVTTSPAREAQARIFLDRMQAMLQTDPSILIV